MVEDDEQLFANELVVEENGDSDSDDEVILNIVCNRKQKWYVLNKKTDLKIGFQKNKHWIEYWIKKLENRIPKK